MILLFDNVFVAVLLIAVYMICSPTKAAEQWIAYEMEGPYHIGRSGPLSFKKAKLSGYLYMPLSQWRKINASPVYSDFPAGSNMLNIFSTRAEYREYVQACQDDFENPWSFREWFETYYYYDMVDQMPTEEQYAPSWHVCNN